MPSKNKSATKSGSGMKMPDGKKCAREDGKCREKHLRNISGRNKY